MYIFIILFIAFITLYFYYFLLAGIKMINFLPISVLELGGYDVGNCVYPSRIAHNCKFE